MYDVIKTPSGRIIKAWTRGVQLEDAARKQLENVAELPFVRPYVVAMPDVHWGIGATVGSVIPTQGAIIPAAIGVDIGCGMLANKTSLRSPFGDETLKELRRRIEAVVPVGRTDNGGPQDRGAWHDVPDYVRGLWESDLGPRYERIVMPRSGARAKNTDRHLGTLGTGNHFIELCVDEEGYVWLLLHSGSRGPGNKIGTYFINLAKELCTRWFVTLPDPDLAYLPEGTDECDAYLNAVEWAQDFATLNRFIMQRNILATLRTAVPFESAIELVHCHHNYVAREIHHGKTVWLTRKGAVRARSGDLGIIPGSMGTRSYIVKGLGSPDSFHSCSHGAGRAMSRHEARRRFTVADHEAATAGVECRKDADVLDETPAAYKDIDAVMAAQTDLVRVVHTLKQIVCVKG